VGGPVTRLNDPAAVASQYAREDNLRARQGLYAETEGLRALDVLWEALVATDPHHVLEVGGGPGELSERMRDELGADISFVDLSPRMVELARERGIAAQVGDVQALPFPDASFDVAVAAWMLYHVPDIDRGIAELARVLEPGGRLVAVTNSVLHLRELRELIAYPSGLFELFSRENGEEFLRPHFRQVKRLDADAVATVRDRARLVAYRESLSVETQPVPDDVGLPFVVHCASSIFVATK
jgi:SAM-dependent methyltransferase